MASLLKPLEKVSLNVAQNLLQSRNSAGDVGCQWRHRNVEDGANDAQQFAFSERDLPIVNRRMQQTIDQGLFAAWRQSLQAFQRSIKPTCPAKLQRIVERFEVGGRSADPGQATAERFDGLLTISIAVVSHDREHGCRRLLHRFVVNPEIGSWFMAGLGRAFDTRPQHPHQSVLEQVDAVVGMGEVVDQSQ